MPLKIKRCKNNIKKCFFILIILFTPFTYSYAYLSTEEEIIILYGRIAYPFRGEPKMVYKCYSKNNQKICEKTFSDEEIKFYRKILEQKGFLKHGEKANAELILRRIHEDQKAAERKKKLEAEKAENKKIQNIKNGFYEF